MEEKKILSTHSLMLENRQNGRITGVKDIKSFDEKEILLFTQAGKLVIMCKNIPECSQQIITQKENSTHSYCPEQQK